MDVPALPIIYIERAGLNPSPALSIELESFDYFSLVNVTLTVP